MLCDVVFCDVLLCDVVLCDLVLCVTLCCVTINRCAALNKPGSPSSVYRDGRLLLTNEVSPHWSEWPSRVISLSSLKLL